MAKSLRQLTLPFVAREDVPPENIPFPLSFDTEKEKMIGRLATMHDYIFEDMIGNQDVIDAFENYNYKYSPGDEDLEIDPRFIHSIYQFPIKNICPNDNSRLNKYCFNVAEGMYESWSKIAPQLSDFDKNIIYFYRLHPNISKKFYMDHKYYPDNYIENGGDYENIIDEFSYFSWSLNEFFKFNRDLGFTLDWQIEAISAHDDFDFYALMIIFMAEIFLDIDNYIPIEHPQSKGLIV